MSDPSPFIPAKLDDAGLTPHEFRVFCRVARRGECTESVGRIAKGTQMNEKTVRDALKALRKRKMIERTKRPGTTCIHEMRPPTEWIIEPNQNGDPSQKKGDPLNRESQMRGDHPSQMRGGDPSQMKGDPSKGNPLEGNPLEGAKGVSAADATLPDRLRNALFADSWEAEPLPDDHPARWDYHPSDWRWEAGRYVLRQLRDHEMLNSHYRKRLNGDCDPGKIASEWADTFRLLVEQDGWQRDEVAITMKWLFETDNWWRRKRTIQSAAALRKKGDDGSTKFDKILQSALADHEQRQEQQTTREDIEQGWDQAIEDVEEELGDELADPGGDAIPSQPRVGSVADER